MKKLLTLALCGIMALSLASCGEKTDTANNEAEKETVTLTVWGSQDQQEMLGEMLEEFKTAHPDKTYEFKLGVVSEADAKTRVTEDPEAAADVFAFANDQLLDLVSAGALAKVTRSADVDYIMENNAPGTVEAAKVDDQLYAFPETADNGYFMYYNKAVFSEEDVNDLDTMLAKANEANGKILMDVSNGWYIASFFLGNGLTLDLTEDGKQICDWNNAQGLEAGEAIKAFTADSAFTTGDDNILVSGLTDGTIVAGVSGTWNAGAVQEALKENYAAAKLPEYTVGDKKVQMGSFAGYKLVGVNSQTAYLADAMDVAAWLTNEANQEKRFETLGMGPSNLTAAKSDAVQANEALAALAAQSQFASSQKLVSGNFWAPAEAFGTAMEAKDYSKSVQELLDDMVAQIIK